MAESNVAPAESNRPRPAILVLLVVALGGVLVYLLWPAAAPTPASSNAARAPRKQASAKGAPAAEGTSGSLRVRLDRLAQTPPPPEEQGRNPFRFYVPPPPAPPPPSKALQPGDKGYVAPPPQPPPQPAGPPPIPLKFIGTVEVKGRKLGIFVSTDGKGMPQYAGEGELVLGQYRVVKIGVESVTLEYLDGRGRQTIPMRG